jgi:hypothetical protein
VVSVSSYTIVQANILLPLVKAIAREMVERRTRRQDLSRTREQLERACSPEGLTGALSNLDADLYCHDEGLRRAQRELEQLGLTVLRTNPVTVHFPGQTSAGDVVFCWQEGEGTINHGHLLGQEEEPRRPLQLRAKGSSRP